MPKLYSPRNKTVPLPRKVATRDIDMARKEHVATYFSSQYVTITTSRGLEMYDKSEPKRLICIYPGEKFIIDSSDDDLEIYRF